ncbi:hypothetical protein RND71_029593 [Anisodus tanguticus]|uniref:Uncharacterized protein n=1 Tax=Anisodus tanguticus TaxID=243964 RepID=A0AAE1RES1_9SOLA|nr:hypothetical protein RND71_029593 [Anisodus tanguticus]
MTRNDENLTPREIEQKAAEFAYFLRVPIELNQNLPFEAPVTLELILGSVFDNRVELEIDMKANLSMHDKLLDLICGRGRDMGGEAKIE